MELNIYELEDTQYDDNLSCYENIEMEPSFEQIPENTVPIKVIKKSVKFTESIMNYDKPLHQQIPRASAKMVRPQIPPQVQKISYEDILSKMGMFVSDGKLHLIDRNSMSQQKQKEILSIQQQFITNNEQGENSGIPQNNSGIPLNTPPPPNSYIYNKYFKDDITPEHIIRKPRNLHEYRRMLLDDYIHRQRVKQIKSTKLIMPTNNIHFSNRTSNNLNKLFNFSKR